MSAFYGTITNQPLSVSDLDNFSVRCLKGYLWVTLENDPNDHILRTNERLPLPKTGKTVIGGRGDFLFEPAIQ